MRAALGSQSRNGAECIRVPLLLQTSPQTQRLKTARTCHRKFWKSEVLTATCEEGHVPPAGSRGQCGSAPFPISRGHLHAQASSPSQTAAWNLQISSLSAPCSGAHLSLTRLWIHLNNPGSFLPQGQKRNHICQVPFAM